jgi:hypothetical protein
VALGLLLATLTVVFVQYIVLIPEFVLLIFFGLLLKLAGGVLVISKFQYLIPTISMVFSKKGSMSMIMQYSVMCLDFEIFTIPNLYFVKSSMTRRSENKQKCANLWRVWFRIHAFHTIIIYRHVICAWLTSN